MDDVRNEELTALQAIYPEMVLSHSRRGGSIKVDVEPENGIAVMFNDPAKPGEVEVFNITHLPPVEVTFELPKGYPESSGPILKLACQWMEPSILRKITKNSYKLWEEQKDQVMFAILDALKEDLASRQWLGGQVNIAAALKDLILDYDGTATQNQFEQQTFKCEICQYFRKGDNCTRMRACGHVFCTRCLTDYFRACIQQGYVDQVMCPLPGCLCPEVGHKQLRELVGDDLVERYITVLDKRRVESSPQLWVECPSSVCGAAVRRNPDDLLSICDRCQFAFCSVCKRSWHGYYEYCRMQVPPPDLIQKYIDGDDGVRRSIELEWGKRNMARIVAEYEGDRLFHEYMLENNNCECPRCQAPIEKTMGCNKMTCLICKTFFCFLCGSVLSSADPYSHYSDRNLPCFQKLFEGTDIEAAMREEDLIRFAFD